MSDAPAGSAARPDALELEIFRYAVESIVDELDVNTQRTAHSAIVYEFKDYCCGFLTSDFELLSQSQHNIPIYVANLGRLVQDAVEVIGVDRLEPGDVFVNNYSAASGSHLNNVCLGAPVHVDDEIVAYVAIRVHWPDVGGLVPGSVTGSSRNLLHEGVQYRGIKLVSGGEVVPEAIATIQANTWLPEALIGDVMANIAACVLGVRRWHEQISSRWNPPEIASLTKAQFESSTALARKMVAELPDGEYEASCEMDDSGELGTPPLRLKLRINVDGSRMLVDLSEMPPQVAAPINSGRYDGAVSAIRVGFKSLLAPERSADEGLFEPLEVNIPDGTVFSAVNNAPMALWQQLVPTLIDLFLKAIGQRLPELVPAGHTGAMAAANIAGEGADGGWWFTINSGGGGFGGSAHLDGAGPLPTLMVGDNPMVPIELREGRYPVRFHTYRVLRSSGGRGLHNGGPGYEETFEVLTEALLSTAMSRTRDPAWGLAGGAPGRPGAIHIKLPGQARWRRVTWLNSYAIPAGTLVRKRTGGGGGWGRPPAPSGRREPGGAATRAGQAR